MGPNREVENMDTEQEDEIEYEYTYILIINEERGGINIGDNV